MCKNVGNILGTTCTAGADWPPWPTAPSSTRSPRIVRSTSAPRVGASASGPGAAAAGSENAAVAARMGVTCSRLSSQRSGSDGIATVSASSARRAALACDAQRRSLKLRWAALGREPEDVNCTAMQVTPSLRRRGRG